MGVSESKKMKTQTIATGTSDPPRGNVQSKVKRVLLLYKADTNNKKQLDLIDAFRDELVSVGLPHINIKNKVNIAKVNASSIAQDLEWLNQVNNVILIRLTPDAVEEVETIIREKNLADNGGVLHDKIMTVSFGKELPQGWPPKGMKRRDCDHQKDFCFGFEDERLLTPQDFDSPCAKKTMNSIVTALLAACS